MQVILRFSFFLLLLFSFSQAKAQGEAPVSLNWGGDYKGPNNSAATKIIGLTPGGFYVLRQKIVRNAGAKPRAWVEYYTRDMKLKRSEELDLKYKGKQRDFEDVILLGNELYLITSFNNSAKKQNFLFKQKISSKSLRVSSRLELIGQTEAKNKEVEGGFAFNISKELEKLPKSINVLIKNTALNLKE